MPVAGLFSLYPGCKAGVLQNEKRALFHFGNEPSESQMLLPGGDLVFQERGQDPHSLPDSLQRPLWMPSALRAQPGDGC